MNIELSKRIGLKAERIVRVQLGGLLLDRNHYKNALFDSLITTVSNMCNELCQDRIVSRLELALF
jgi:hypothetical protein